MRHFIGLAAMRRLLPALAIAIAFPFAGATAEDLKKIRVTIPVPVMTIYPLMVAKDQGFFAKQGYDVEIISTSGDGPDVDALISGSVEFTVSTPNRLLTTNEQGKPLLAVMNVTNRLSFDCVMNTETAKRVGIKPGMSLDDKLKTFRGLTVAGTRAGSLTYLMLVDYAKRAGLEPQKDVKIVGIGGPPAMLPAVENGRVDVVCGASPIPELAVAHGKAIMLTDNLGGKDDSYDNMLFELLYVRPDYAKEHPEIVRGMVKAMIEATDWIYATSSKDQLPELRSRFSGVSDEILIEMLDKARPTFKKGGAITEEAVTKAARFLIGTGSIASAPPWQSVSSNAYLPSN